MLDLDIDTGFGPETISLKSAGESGRYLLLAHAFNLHGAGSTLPRAVIKMGSDLVGEFVATQGVSANDEVWVIAEISYPDGAITEVNQFTTHEDLGGPPH